MQRELDPIERNYVLMPVPLYSSRIRKRGFNQAFEIAAELAKLSGHKMDCSLRRIRNTNMQAQLKLNQRADNVKGAFAVSGPLINKKIILIDDVMTTGYTLNECAKALRKAGATDIKVLVFARKSL